MMILLLFLWNVIPQNVLAWSPRSSSSPPFKIILTPRIKAARARVDEILRTSSTASFGIEEQLQLDDSNLASALKELMDAVSIEEENNNSNENKKQQQRANYRSFDPKRVAGTWRVVHAPHLAWLSNLVGANFRPIEYHVTADCKMVSTVRYNNVAGGKYSGWLSTAGYYYKENKDTDEDDINMAYHQSRIMTGNNVRIVWTQAWWNPDEEEKRGERRQRPTPPDGGIFPKTIQQLGKLGFIEPLSVFPIEFVDDTLTIFKFFGFAITAARCADPQPSLYISSSSSR